MEGIIHSAVKIIVFFVIILVGCGTSIAGELKKNYYSQSCPLAETIVKNISERLVASNANIAARLLRLHFHDCFVRGCDGSVLIDSTATNTAEKGALPNRFVSGFEFIDEMKAELEKTCPGVVSCADIVALAARDTVSYQFRRPLWDVFTGRKDGRVSLVAEAAANLPSSFVGFPTLLKNFQDQGLNWEDLVILSGGHTIGNTHCTLLKNRLYDFAGNNDTDPDLNSDYTKTLMRICPNGGDPLKVLDMDPGSSTSFDTNYFIIVSKHMGIFQSDEALLKDPKAAQLVRDLQNPSLFFPRFAASMKKMGEIILLQDGEGEIRKNCRVIINP